MLNRPLRNASGNLYSTIDGASALPPAPAMRGGGLDDLKEDSDDF